MLIVDYYSPGCEEKKFAKNTLDRRTKRSYSEEEVRRWYWYIVVYSEEWNEVGGGMVVFCSVLMEVIKAVLAVIRSVTERFSVDGTLKSI